jgi:hypothetical protein
MFQVVGLGGSGFFAMPAVSVAKECSANKKNVDAGDAELGYAHACSRDRGGRRHAVDFDAQWASAMHGDPA